MIPYIEQLRSPAYLRSLGSNALAVMLGSLFIALSAQLALPLWFTPVPLSMLTVGVFLTGASLGSRRGALAVLAFLFEGAIGLPVFGHFSSGLGILFGPTAGYLLGCIVAAYTLGALVERGWIQRSLLTLLALSIVSFQVLFLGALWLSFFVGIQGAWSIGVLPFLLGDALKIGLVATLLPRACKLFR